MALEHPGLEPVFYRHEGPPPPDVARARLMLSTPRTAAELEEYAALAPHLEYVQAVSSGTDHLVGLPARVGYGSGRGSNGMVAAELALGLVLTSFRRLDDAVRSAQRAVWEPTVGRSLYGSEILVIGAGDLAQQFKVRVEACGATATLSGRTARGDTIAISQLKEHLSGKQAVVIMVPLTPQTAGLVDKAFLAAMDDGALLVNVARGGIVDQDALMAECRAGRLKAALDVADPEPLPPGHPLWTCPGVLVTPHIGGEVRGFMERAFRLGIDQLAAYARGERPSNMVRAPQR
jgi:phosphoglycerate dehydrogenase-like enzyme